MALFDRLAETYDAWYETPLGRKVDQLEKELLFRVARPIPGAKVLDAGCGTGRLALEFARMGCMVTGVDVSPAMLEKARRRTGTLPGVALVQADVEKLPFPGAAFDLVLAFTVLEFTPNPGAAVRELWRVVKPGGSLVVGALNAWSPWARRRRRQARRRGGIFAQAAFFSYRDLKTLLTAYTGETNFSWDACVFIPPWAGPLLIGFAAPLERAARPLLRPLGALIIARVDKRTVIRPVFVPAALNRPRILTRIRPQETQATRSE